VCVKLTRRMIEAYLLITTPAGTSRAVLQQLRDLEGVQRANVIAGEFDIAAIVEADSTQELLAFVTDDIQSLEDVSRTRTCVVVE
jgi:DNA-binding Lrp family transcriptional regulator